MEEYNAEVSTGNYVQDDSMVLWLDALNNTGSGFDPDAAYWTNLATLGQTDENGEEKEPESYKLGNFTKGSWKSNGLYLTGYREYIDTIDNGELGHKIRTDENGKRYTGATISMMLKMDDDHHNIDNYVIYNRSSVLGGFELRFRSDGYTLPFVDNIALYADTPGTLEQGFIKGSTWPALYKTDSGKNIGGKYVQLTMVYKTYLGDTSADNTMDFTMYLDGQELYNVRRTGGFESRYGNLLRFGGTSWSSDTYSSMRGTIGSIMGYDRDLTAEEVGTERQSQPDAVQQCSKPAGRYCK